MTALREITIPGVIHHHPDHHKAVEEEAHPEVQ
jgi:hypothetical protein